MRIYYLFLAVALYSLSSCGPTNSKNMNTLEKETSVENHFWLLETLNGEKINHPKDPRKIGFETNSESKRVSGFAGCNTFMGGYELKSSNKISFTPMASTRMACFQSPFNEAEFLTIFEKVDAFKIEGNKLSLLNGNKVLARFLKDDRKATEPIVEKYWKLTSLDGKEVKTSAEQEREVHFILKDKDSRITGFGGCNSFSGSFELKKDSKIEFSKIISTLRACPDVEFEEHKFLDVFNKTTSYTVDGDHLTLKDKSGKTLALFEAVYFD